MDCIFCKIIKGEIPSFTVYEDELVKVFLDINPITNGHMLVVPKKHIENRFGVDNDLRLHINEVAEKMNDLLKEKLSSEGLTLIQNNGHGQDVKHYHLHLVPRYSNDKVKYLSNEDILVNCEDVYNQIKN